MIRRASIPLLLAVLGAGLATVGLLRQSMPTAASSPQVAEASIDLLVPDDDGSMLVRMQMLIEVPAGMTEEEAVAHSIEETVDSIPGAVPANAPGVVTAAYVQAGWLWETGEAYWSYNDSGRPTNLPQAYSSLVAAAQTWNDAGANFQFTGGYPTGAIPGLCIGQGVDGVNAVTWAPTLPGTTLAVTCTIPKDGPHATESDIRFDATRDWTLGDDNVGIDFQSVAVHEFGHMLGLGHATVQNSVMYGTYQTGALKRQLQADDLQGLYSLYGAQVDPTHTPTVTNTPTPTPTATKNAPSTTATTSATPTATPTTPPLPIGNRPIFVPGLRAN